MMIFSRLTNLLLVVATIFLCVQLSSAQVVAPIVPVGKVVEKVSLRSRPDQSYAAFLPSNYTLERSWPTIFCLDPRARGKIAIERFVEAAEKYGYIVICSNNSRNGLSAAVVSQIFTDLWDDTHTRFTIDEKRTYAAGFSGGARLAVTFASRCQGCLAGVIAGGAGFPGGLEPDSKTSFLFFGVAGVDDFNFGEMVNLDKKLHELKVPHRFEAVAGGHEWTPKEAITEAVAWLTLQTLKTGVATKDEKFIDEQFSTRMAAAKRFLTDQQYTNSLRAYRAIARDFEGLRDVKFATDQAEQLGKSDPLRKEDKAQAEAYLKQLREAGEIRSMWMKPFDADQSRSFRSEATVRIADWRKKREATNDSSERRLARRILSQLMVESFEAAQPSIAAKDYNQALANFQLGQAIDPRNANLSFEIARIYGLKRQKKPAIESLEQAVELGFKDADRIKSEEAFAEIAADARFQKLLNSLQKQ